MRATVRLPTLLRLAMALAAAFLHPGVAAAVAPPFPGAEATTLANPDGEIPIPDNGSLVSVVTFTGGGIVVDVDVDVDITHTNASNLDVSLVAPSGRTVTLTSDNGGDNDDVFAGTRFDDQATGDPSAPNVRNFEYMDLEATGAIQPEEPLGALVGEEAFGPWALVVVDDQGGNTGTLRDWSITIVTLGGAQPSPPTTVEGEGALEVEEVEGLAATANVSGLGAHLYDVDVTVDLMHPTAADVELFLTSPSGRTVDLVTDIGGGNDDLWVGTTFDDQSGALVADQELPEDGVAFERVVGEGALSAFNGEDPNGTWTLTVVDDNGTPSGTLNSWSLRLVTATACGDGSLDPGEICDDGNQVNGDGCDSNCTPTACGNGVVSPDEDCDDGNIVGGDFCPSTCRNGETSCDDCIDNDLNGLVDAVDPACEPTDLRLRSARLSTRRGTLKLRAGVTLPEDLAGSVMLVLGDADGPPICASLGDIQRGKAGKLVAQGPLGEGTVTVTLSHRKGGALRLKGRGIGLDGIDDPSLSVGLSVGGTRFTAGGQLRARRGGRWVLR